jgi:hypothetical protein
LSTTASCAPAGATAANPMATTANNFREGWGLDFINPTN